MQMKLSLKWELLIDVCVLFVKYQRNPPLSTYLYTVQYQVLFGFL